VTAGRRARIRTAALVAMSGFVAVGIAEHAGVAGPGATDEVAWIAAVTLALFAVCGLGLTRLLLPEPLREHELLWILPIGACAAALELGILGYARVPLPVSLAVLLAGNAALAVVAVRRHGPPARPARLGEIGWPLWAATLVACVALIPMFRAGFATVVGYGSDAHMAAGTAQLLRDHPPTAVAIEEPVDQLWTVWRSKPPIYYPVTAVAELSGMQTWEVLSTFASILLALACLGFFLLAREMLGAGLAGATFVVWLVGLNRVALFTTMHPYFNQMWGLMTLPYALLLAYWLSRLRVRAAAVLLGVFLAVGAFAYPLAVPIPLLALAIFLWPERGRLRGLLPRRRRTWLGVVPLLLLLSLPVAGILEKQVSAVGIVVDPGRSLAAWGGDLTAFVPEYQFLSMSSWTALAILGPVLAVLSVRELRRQPRTTALALAAVVVFGLVAAAWFRPRDVGWYFHFKALAFAGPLAVAIATVAVARTGRFAPWGLAVLVLVAIQGARDETVMTSDQTPRPVVALREVDAQLPPGASVRLDMDPNKQVWGAYFLSGQPLCSKLPLLDTAYPHVPFSVKADYVVVDSRESGRPPDAVGAPVWRGEWFALYRLRPDIPGPDRCSRRMVQTI
jgi:hypothetical protein